MDVLPGPTVGSPFGGAAFTSATKIRAYGFKARSQHVGKQLLGYADLLGRMTVQGGLVRQLGGDGLIRHRGH